MILPAIPLDDEHRLFALAQFSILDTPPEAEYDRVTKLVAAICNVPVALISLVDAKRQWFKSKIGIQVCETSRDVSFCAHAINYPDGIFVVEDTLLDPRFRENPVVAGDPHVRFYAGAPLVTNTGFPLGTVCIVDLVPRSLAAVEIATLEHAAQSVVNLLEHRRSYNILCALYSSPASEPDTLPPVSPVESRAPDICSREIPHALPTDLPSEIIHSVPGIFYVCETDGTMLFWNRHLEELTGYTQDEIRARMLCAFLREDDVQQLQRRVQHALIQGTAYADVKFIAAGGESIPVYLTIKTISYEGRTCLSGFGVDISEHKQREDLLKYAASHDALTGLGNRTMIYDRILHSIYQADQNGGHVAVFFFDLDRFKLLNDTLGHFAGDELLKDIAQRLRSRVSRDHAVGRLGGDEFVIAAEVATQADVEALAQSVMASFEQPFSIAGRTFFLTTSLGVSIYPLHGSDPEHLLRNADAAMYHAKELGRNNYQIFTQDLHFDDLDRLNVESDLRLGLERGEFELYYLPVVNMRTGEAISAEGLIRWHHPTRGLVPPNDFIPIAEESGLIVPIGAWVIEEGVRQTIRMQQLGIDNFYLSINVSAHQLRDPFFMKHVETTLAQSDPPVQSLGLEITESAALGDPDGALATLDKCKNLKLRILLDDFGTQYSSLTYLKKFPIDVIKIDKSFIDGIPANSEDCGIVKTIIALGDGLDCDVLAEGVETPEQAQWLAENGCGYATGYLFARPMPAAKLEAWLLESRRTQTLPHAR